MPKFKDLGINVVPVTMRPPEIGDGAAAGGNEEDTECGSNTCVGDDDDESEDTECGSNTCVRDDVEDTECGSNTCVHRGDDLEDTECGSDTCVPKPPKPGKDKKNTGAFSPDAIAQLEQQMDQQLGT